jgi:imidazolonepropionase-like amidohydrolase
VAGQVLCRRYRTPFRRGGVSLQALTWCVGLALSGPTHLAQAALSSRHAQLQQHLGSSARPKHAYRTADTLLAVVGVTVIDPSSTNPPATDQTIVISNGVIRAVGPARSVAVPPGARRVVARGKFAIPGLWDAHVHFMNTGVTALPLLVAQGVTSVREMGGFIDSTRAWQSRMRNGSLVGPRILTPGPILESPRYLQGVRERSARGNPELATRVLPYRLSVGDSAEAAHAVDSLVRLHVDFVKIRTTSTPAAYFAALREARRAGLKVAGHQPSVVSLATAVDSGQNDIEHAILPPLSRLPDAARDSLYRRMAQHGTWYTPTLVVSRAVSLSGDSAARAIFGPAAVAADERRAYASPWLLGWWRMQVDERIADTSSARAAAVEESYRSSASDVRRMQDAGVALLAGTDAGSVLVYPGFSLHEELQLLVEDGRLTPREALMSATAAPARFAGMESTLGTIATGKIADIVLLDADPLANIRNTRRIYAVIQAGRLHARSDLDAMLKEIRAAVR